MNKSRYLGWILVLAGVGIIGRKTYLVALIAPQQTQRSLLDTVIILTGGMTMALGFVLLQKWQKQRHSNYADENIIS